MYNLTDSQKNILRWLVQEVRKGSINEEFKIYWDYSYHSPDQPIPQAGFLDYDGELEQSPETTMGVLDALAANNLILCEATFATRNSGSSYETRRRCTLQGRAYEAVDTNFDAPDTSFVKHLIPIQFKAA